MTDAMKLLEHAAAAAYDAERWEGQSALAGVRRADARKLAALARTAAYSAPREGVPARLDAYTFKPASDDLWDLVILSSRKKVA